MPRFGTKKSEHEQTTSLLIEGRRDVVPRAASIIAEVKDEAVVTLRLQKGGSRGLDRYLFPTNLVSRMIQK